MSGFKPQLAEFISFRDVAECELSRARVVRHGGRARGRQLLEGAAESSMPLKPEDVGALPDAALGAEDGQEGLLVGRRPGLHVGNHGDQRCKLFEGRRLAGQP